jgi:enediyne biosynthesis protein E4
VRAVPFRGRRLWPVVVAGCIWAGWAVPAGAAPGPGAIKLRLSFVDGVSSAPQGAPFPFAVTARNTGSSERTISVTIELRSPSSGSTDIRSWKPTLPPGGSLTEEMSEASSQWFAEVGAFSLQAKLRGGPSGNLLTYQVTAPTVTVPTFEDVTSSSGLSTVLPNDADTSHSEGAAWGDANGDGYPDLFVPIRDQPAQLWVYEPAGETFREAAASWRVSNPDGVGVSAVFADYDNDGDPDLYVVNDAMDPATGLPKGQGNRLYRNESAQGHQWFTDVSAQAGLGTQGNGSSASWGDYDDDGYLDLYVVTSNTFIPKMTYYHPDHLFHNEGDGTFTDVTCQTIPTNDQASGFCPEDPAFGGSTGSGFQAVWIDHDGDGDQDIYLAQDYYLALVHKDINRLYRNDGFDPPSGRWRFTDVCAEAEDDLPECAQINSMGIGVGDYDGDRWPDLAVSNAGGHGGNILLENGRDGTFSEVGVVAGVARPDQDARTFAFTWGLGFFDFNLDAHQDLFVAAGSLQGGPNQPDQVFTGGPSSSFLDLSAPSGAADPAVGRGVSFADYDRDGLVDAYVVNVNGSPTLLRNTTVTGGHWLEVQLTGTASNRDACGARVVLAWDGGTQARWVLCGSSLGAGDDRVLHFGGVGAGDYTLTVWWPSGLRQTVAETGTDRLVSLIEGEG